MAAYFPKVILNLRSSAIFLKNMIKLNAQYFWAFVSEEHHFFFLSNRAGYAYAVRFKDTSVEEIKIPVLAVVHAITP
ncbi:hypothetical protein DAPPUDRAFT_341679 [Daphnia pulex]|uniref:Uncharacterized protein n=1 Tax=Daphnia pulex TaxID=6669 RepID=E9I5I7_DAPPU|nr:hypothetical protein DAPPUDRAFT_341679 [Daphnia pulex]|eukprot:EFX60743.1 hypothetical protein DAPPUDRAFT_341679 [Daphnia pulex]